MKSKWQISKGLIGWLGLVAFFFMVVFPSFVDYTARVQMSEALSKTREWQTSVENYYEKYHHCPTDQNLFNSPVEGKYLETLHLTKLKGSNNCYILAKLRQSSLIDRRVRGKSLVLVVSPLTTWQPQVTCQTDLQIDFAYCQADSLKGQ